MFHDISNTSRCTSILHAILLHRNLLFACIAVCSMNVTDHTIFRYTTKYIFMYLAIIKDANVFNTRKAINCQILAAVSRIRALNYPRILSAVIFNCLSWWTSQAGCNQCLTARPFKALIWILVAKELNTHLLPASLALIWIFITACNLCLVNLRLNIRSIHHQTNPLTKSCVIQLGKFTEFINVRATEINF